MEWKRIAFDWNQARAFLATAEEGSLSAAARALGLTQPTLSRQVTSLEEALGVTLFERTSRVLLLTQAGTQLLEHFRAMGDAAQRVSITAAGQAETMTGHVVIACTDLMATHFLPPMLKTLQQAAPHLKVEIVTSNQVTDLVRREADIAIRHSRPHDEALYAKRLRDTSARLYAASAYLAAQGRPTSLADMAGLHFAGVDHPEYLLKALEARGLTLTMANFNFLTASATLTLSLVRNGLGACFLPIEVAQAYPELEEVWPELAPIGIETWLVAHRELRTNPQMRLVFDVLTAGFAQDAR